MELFIVVTPGEPSKSGLCAADDLEICDQFSSSSGESVDHDQHKGSEGMTTHLWKESITGFFLRTMVIGVPTETGNESSKRN